MSYLRHVAKILLISCLFQVWVSGHAPAHQNGNRSSSKVNGPESSVVQSLEKTIPQLMKEGEVPGLSSVLIRDAKIYWHRGFGVKNAETKAPIEDTTVFEIASLTKPVLAYGALKLVDSGKLDLDTPLVKYLPGSYVEGDDRSNQITARMVLSHTTGLQNELHPGERLKIHFAPGERFSYSGEGFIYLQRVIEHITGERIDAFMNRVVFEPLDMKSASYVWLDKYETLMANGHNAAGIVAERIKPVEVRISWLHMNALDYSRFAIAVMNGIGLKKSTAKLMLTPQVRLNESCVFCLSPGSGRVSPSLSWGLGWGIEHSKVGDALWHWGENRGEFQTFAMVYPKEKLGIVVFTNSGNGHSIIPEIVSQAIGGSHPAFDWMGYDLYNSPKKIQFRAYNLPIKLLFTDILVRGQTALYEYRVLHKDRPGPGKLTEDQVNTLGYWLKGRKRMTEAVEVFKMNAEDFPNSSNAFDSLGEAYMDIGDKAAAIKGYQKSLELNPKNTNAVEMLKRLQN